MNGIEASVGEGIIGVGDFGVVIGVFTDQAYNLILLAEDVARMLGQAVVGPEHLLLALARRGNVASLLAQEDLTATDIYNAIVRGGGFSDQLVLGRVPRSAEAEAALERAVRRAAERGVLGPSSEHLLLGLIANPSVRAILGSVGIDDPEALVNGTYPPDRRPPLNAEQVRRYAERAVYVEPPRPGPIPPVFERFTAQARAAVMASSRFPRDGDYIEPLDLMLGLMSVPDGVAATVLASHGMGLAQTSGRIERLRPSRGHRATRPMQERRPPHLRLEPELPQLISEAARRLVAEGALKQAYENGQRTIGSGHLLLAVLDGGNGAISDVLGGKDAVAVATSVRHALPGDERV